MLVSFGERRRRLRSFKPTLENFTRNVCSTDQTIPKTRETISFLCEGGEVDRRGVDRSERGDNEKHAAHLFFHSR